MLSYLFLFLVLLSPDAVSSDTSVLEITFLDVGYADAILITSPKGQHILFDGGDVTKPDFVSDFLKERGIDKLDLVILSHPHKNHFGGMFGILDRIEVGEIVWNGEMDQEEPFSSLLTDIKKRKIPIRVTRAGERLDISEELHFAVLHSPDMTSDVNNNSLVMKAYYRNVSVLFTADIGPSIQDKLIDEYGDELFSDLIQIPHHGGPLSDRFLDFFEQSVFVLSTGPNQWGLPKENQISRLRGTVFRTDEQGDLVFQSNGNKIWRVTKNRSGERH